MATLAQFLRTGFDPTIDSDDPVYTPFVTGFMFGYFYIPDGIMTDMSKGLKPIDLATRVLAIDLGDVTIATGERIGLGGLKQIIATTVDIQQQLTMRFQEDENLTITKIITDWAQKIRSIYTGRQLAKKYKGHVDLLITTPAIEPVMAIRFRGAWPAAFPWQHLTPDVTSNQVSEVNLTFNFDRPILIDYTENDIFKEIVESAKDNRYDIPIVR